MREIIENVRTKLAPFIDSGIPKAVFELPEEQFANPGPQDFSYRFTRKNPFIPTENYDKLPKLVPIGWL